jgi:hypothetical protein
MNKIIDFYELYESELLEYNKEYINKLYEIIIDEKKSFYNNNWNDYCDAIIDECSHFVSSMNNDYLYKTPHFILLIKDSLLNHNSKKTENLYIVKKLNLYVQLFEYLKSLNHNTFVFFDKDKYELTINTYNIFLNFDVTILESMIEWYSNYFVFFYSKSNKYTNICIYKIDDLFGYKLFLTFRKDNIMNEIIINTCDTVIDSEEDFYNKINFTENWKVLDSFTQKNMSPLININLVAECFTNSNINVKINFIESQYICVNKILKFVEDFLKN